MHYIGIDLGGTNIAAGVVDERMHILAQESIPTNCPRCAETIVEDMASLAGRLMRRCGLEEKDIAWIGVGTPGSANIETGVVEYCNNLHFDNVPLRPMLSRRTHKEVFLENDANAAAYGETIAGAAKGASSAVIVTLGTGVGTGVFSEGKILHGCNYSGAEIGHMVIKMGGAPCTCGRKGCWEAYSSATGLIRMTKEAMREHPESGMWKIAGGNIDSVDGKTAFDAMRQGDRTGREVVVLYSEYLACGLVNVINIFQPEVLCIGGGLSREFDTLMETIGKMVEKERYSRYSARQTDIRAARLGNDAGIIGAAMLGKLSLK